jgi:hypothetical protein
MLAWLPTVWEPRWAALDLHHLYRGLDVLAEVGPELERVIFDGYRDLFHLELDLVFFDTTSTYFVDHPRTPLAQRGDSQDRRPDRQQLLLGLLMTRDGLPVGHWVFPGATVDHQAMAAALQDLQARWPITRLIVVGDRGMLARISWTGWSPPGGNTSWANRCGAAGGWTRSCANGGATSGSAGPTAPGPWA